MPEIRKDPVSARWVIFADERAKRPTDFARERVIPKSGRVCPFCPGNENLTPPEVLAFRTAGSANEPGWTTRVIPNKFPALCPEGDVNRQGDGLYEHMNGIGVHEVIIETPDHAGTLGDMSAKQIAALLNAGRERILDLKRDQRIRHVLIFKNHGEAAGATLEHSHSQLIGLPIVPLQVQAELDGARRYFGTHACCVFCEIVRREVHSKARLILETEHCVALAPYAPRFAFETWMIPTLHESHFDQAGAACIEGVAALLRTTMRKLDKVLNQPAYNLVLHTAPLNDDASASYHWHIELIPRRSKIAGFEWGSGYYINPTLPEESARLLREADLPSQEGR